MPRRAVPLIPGQCYHIFNRGVDRDPVFFQRENYLFFLRRLREHLLPITDVIAYCLMPNHYHLLVLIQTSEVYGEQSSPDLGGLDGLEGRGLSRAMMRLSVSFIRGIFTRRLPFPPLFHPCVN